MSDSPLCVLNIDDYLPARYARTKVLRQAGFSVLEAATGKEALQIVNEHKPTVVLLDVNLPDMSGFDVCDRIRKNPETTATTIIHVSASNIEHIHMVTGLDDQSVSPRPERRGCLAEVERPTRVVRLSGGA
jgi:two-component system, sensor histidine kinase